MTFTVIFQNIHQLCTDQIQPPFMHPTHSIDLMLAAFIYEWKLAILIFLCLAYFTKHNVLQLYFPIICDSISLFFMAEYSSAVHRVGNFFIGSSVPGHLGCIHILTVMSCFAFKSYLKVILEQNTLNNLVQIKSFRNPIFKT